MSESVQISDELREHLESRGREDETVAETLQRLASEHEENGTGPHPAEVAGIISSETAEKMRERIARKDEQDAKARRQLRERFE